MNRTKIQFSKPEAEMMCNAEIILTKNMVLQKIRSMFEEVQQCMVDYSTEKNWQSTIDAFKITAKISRGENYEGLPYLILDYPRLFNKEDIFAVRTMFWWGNFFSTTLHVAGQHKQSVSNRILMAMPLLERLGFYAGINEDPWQHHFEASNYMKIEKESYSSINLGSSHLKIAHKLPVDNWAKAPEILFSNWNQLMNVCLD
jgi:hypothetical protein